ncbi:elongation factor EF-2 [Candidatus Marsarchaeota G2 archaeon ECH_B_SAG-G16]|uniref:Elongation factor 2 n=4 Tax=Candidatus Marsarchaeota TaxID=1978152 RepID=A0A2R6AE24_9ARCH|nr:MAG: elongation factor EF-2 [Candidatus Marsarchaeota G1 archaeon OSP_D]PSN89696.1 MAG: elongation factor EF-2 [Candidatus Marsarchaeota G1 archaeon OSP_C]PSN95466.1 MAG: elongation factor EF-2 [Candidatus Marsarchaeota G1 archaeon OSP_B]PSO04259.1 MAG: elongation factor EF-2 [Candidatus Marsarchaeota G2 archaeon ECH_B_SAG-G16]
MPKYKQTEEILRLMQNTANIRNMGIIAHVDHGKTTLSDNLLLAAGIISPKVAGTALAMDYLEIEQKRQITVKAANVSLLHEHNGQQYVINMIDTPGHVDFTGKVTRSLRVMDGAVVVVDSVEGVMTQTETVTRQALEERVRPVLYINKIDRLVKELRLSPQEVQERLLNIVRDFNTLIENYAEPEFRERWKVNINKGQVAFGAAKDKWGFTLPISIKKGLKFADIVAAYNNNDISKLVENFPLYVAILDMVVEHMPNPLEAQKYRIPKLWKGDPNSRLTSSMLACDPNGPLVIAVNNVVVDPHAGLVATGRVFSGTIKEGQEVYLVSAKTNARVLQVGLFMGQNREIAKEIPAGNIVAMLGLEQARAGETIIEPEYKSENVGFEKLKYVSEPVVTIAVEPKNSRDLPRFVDALHKMSIEDPNLILKINEETGEYLISGMGQLHLEIVLYELQQRGFDVVTSPPIVVYRETVQSVAGPVEGKSPNKHNRFRVVVEPLDQTTISLIQSGEVYDGQDFRERAKILREKAGWDTNQARNIWAIDDLLNVFVDATKGIQHLLDIKDTLIQGFRWAMEAGPLAQEPMRGVKVLLTDAIIHEDPAHRGPAQVMPAIKNAILAAVLMAKPTLLEPLLKLDIRIPTEYVSSINRIAAQKRGRVLEVNQVGAQMRMVLEMPVSETFNLSTELRSATAGKAFWGQEFSRWSPIPESLLMQVVTKIRERKGLPKEIPKPEDLLE